MADETKEGSNASPDSELQQPSADATASAMSAPTPDQGGAGTAPEMPDFSDQVLTAVSQPIDLIGDVELNVKVELGRCQMAVEDVLHLAEGSVVELDKLAGDPVDVLVNDRLVARGEVLVLNDTFCVRVNEIVSEEVVAS